MPQPIPELDYYNPMADRSIFEQFPKGTEDAVTDIRRKIVEEPMYGRAVTEREAGAPARLQAREMEPARSLVQEQDRKAPEQAIDR
jgi:hypothetical protein